jgi:hypothetical protein
MVPSLFSGVTFRAPCILPLSSCRSCETNTDMPEIILADMGYRIDMCLVTGVFTLKACRIMNVSSFRIFLEVVPCRTTVLIRKHEILNLFS